MTLEELVRADARFAQFEIRGDDYCWCWTASTTQHGYGRISWRGVVRRVHRVVASLVYGIDLDGEDRVCHHCDTPSCFRPDHLFIGTQADNVADMVRKGRAAGGDKPHSYCAKGHPLEGDNIKPDKRGRRRCRECDRQSQREYYRRRKEREGAFWKSQPSRQTIRALGGDIE